MNSKKLMALIMTVIMAVGMTVVFTACSDSESQDGQQDAAVSEENDGSADENQEGTEEGAVDPSENTSEVVETVNGYVDLAGEYQDEWSGRASATVIANTESRSANITVTWSGSASESAVWTMNAVKDGNKLVYSDCVKRVQTVSEDLDDEGTGDEDGMGGGAQETIEYENGAGSFEISDDGKLLWNGADEPDCASCVFVKVTE